MRQDKELTLVDILSIIILNKIYLLIIFIFFCGITIVVVQTNSKVYYTQNFVIKNIKTESVKNIDLSTINKIEELNDLVSSDIKRHYASIFNINSKDKQYHVKVSADNKEQAETYLNKLSKNVYNFFILINKNNLLKKQKTTEVKIGNLTKQIDILHELVEPNILKSDKPTVVEGFKILYPVIYAKLTLLSSQYYDLINKLEQLNKILTLTQEQYISAVTPIYQEQGIGKTKKLLIGFVISLILSIIMVLFKSLVETLIRNYKNEQ